MTSTLWTRMGFIASVSLTSACASCDPAHPRDARPDPSERVRAAPRALVASQPEVLTPLGPDQLCVTTGHVGATSSDNFTVDAPKVRAVAASMTLPVAELRFVYLGPTVKSAPLRSGAHRRQLGLKLRAQNGCNVVYVMWRIEPTQGLVVSVKHNPGDTVSAQCDNHGYHDVAPIRTAPLPPLSVGSPHVLHAEARGELLEVTIDGAPVWAGMLPPEALSFDGPAGFRTDNVRIEAKLLAVLTGAAPPETKCSGQEKE